MKSKQLLVVLTSILISSYAIAQEDTKAFTPTFNWSGFTHLWGGLVQRDSLEQHYGFAVRYLRFKASGKLTEKVKWAIQFGFDRGNPALLDASLAYEPTEYFKVQFGQFPVPGAKSGVLSSPLWSTTKMMFNDRATVTQNWASNVGLKGYRSGGVMVYGSFLRKIINYYAMAAMPSAGPKYYFNPSVKSPTYQNDENGKALFTRLEIKPAKKIELGVNYHIGKGSRFDTLSVSHESYSLYFISRQKQLFLMSEFIGGKNSESINSTQNNEFSYSGYKIELAYKLKSKYEPAIRYDTYIPIKNKVDNNGYTEYNNLTFGFNYYSTQNITIMLNYVVRMEEPALHYNKIHNNLLYFQLCYKFKSI